MLQIEEGHAERDTGIRELERMLEDERRKSMADVEKIKRIEA